MNMPVLQYKDYRLFLYDLYKKRKATLAKYSYRQFAKDLGFNPSNFIHLVVVGKRNLSPEGIKTIQSRMKWSAQEKNYFHHLVLHNQSDEDKRPQHLKKLETITQKKRITLSPDQYVYFSNWYFPVLREMVNMSNFVSNLTWFARKLHFKIDERMIQDALKILERLGFIRRRAGRWEQMEEHLTTEVEVTSDMVYNYHHEMIKLSSLALVLPQEDRQYGALTMGLSERQFAWLKRRVLEFQDEVQQYLQETQDPSTLVAQLNLQLFATTKK